MVDMTTSPIGSRVPVFAKNKHFIKDMGIALDDSKRMGLELIRLADLIGRGAAGCWSINQLGPRMVQSEFYQRVEEEGFERRKEPKSFSKFSGR